MNLVANEIHFVIACLCHKGWFSDYIFMYYWMNSEYIHVLWVYLWAAFHVLLISIHTHWNFEYTKDVTLHCGKSGRWSGPRSCNCGGHSLVPRSHPKIWKRSLSHLQNSSYVLSCLICNSIWQLVTVDNGYGISEQTLPRSDQRLILDKISSPSSVNALLSVRISRPRRSFGRLAPICKQSWNEATTFTWQ